MPRVIGIHHLTLKDGVTPEEFAAFARNEWKDLAMPDIHFSLAKADRGHGVGSFVEIIEMDLATRDRYFPTGPWSDEAKAIWERVTSSPKGKHAWERWNALVAPSSDPQRFSDYIIIDE